MKRLYFLVPDIDSASRIVAEMRDAGVAADHVSVVGSDHHRLEQAHLHEAGVLHGTHLVDGLKTGLALGGTTGIIAGIAAVSFPPAGLILGGGAIVGLGVLGAGVGGWLGSMLGIAATDPGIHRFHDEIQQGRLLLLIDIPKERELEMLDRIRRHHPEARIESVPHRSLSFGSLLAREEKPVDYWDSHHL